MTSPLLQAAALTWIWDEAHRVTQKRPVTIRDTRDPDVTRAALDYIKETR